MTHRLMLGSVLLGACGPVVLFANEREFSDAPPVEAQTGADAGSLPDDLETTQSPQPSVSVTGASPASEQPSHAPEVQLAVKSVACGRCFVLVASGSGGSPPYSYEWEDGSSSRERRVCAGVEGFVVSIIAIDAAAARSVDYVAHFQADAEAGLGCEDSDAGAGNEGAVLCLANPSFEGSPAINTGQTFDAAPWTSCTDASAANTNNTPDIANATLDPVMGLPPTATDGATYLTLNGGEQTAQKLCRALTPLSKVSLELDAVHFGFGNGAGNREMVLQVWGGLAADCSSRQLLWASGALDTAWTRFCVTLEPTQYMDQLILRAETPTPGLGANFAAVDNLHPIDACP